MSPTQAPPTPRDATLRFFDHTGDWGVDLEAPTLDALVAGVARAFATVLTDDPDRIAPRETRLIDVRGVDGPATLVALGNELVYLFDAEKFLVARLEPTITEETRITGVALGEPYDPARHPIARPMKAVTHHGASLEVTPGRVTARLIFDL